MRALAVSSEKSSSLPRLAHRVLLHRQRSLGLAHRARQVDAFDGAVAQLQRGAAGQVGTQRCDAGARGADIGGDPAAAFEQVLAGHVLEQGVDVDAAGRELDRDAVLRASALPLPSRLPPQAAGQAGDAQRRCRAASSGVGHSGSRARR
jgi:hypothetical protein